MSEAYLVRLIDSKQFVGVFIAPNTVRLFWLIDEEGNPLSCEYARLGAGGVFSGVDAPSVGDGGSENEADELFVGGGLTADWWYSTTSGHGNWKRFPDVSNGWPYKTAESEALRLLREARRVAR